MIKHSAFSTWAAGLLFLGILFSGGCAYWSPTPDASRRVLALAQEERTSGAAYPTQGSEVFTQVLTHWQLPVDRAASQAQLDRLGLGNGLEEALIQSLESSGLWVFASFGDLEKLKQRVRAGVPVVIGIQEAWKKLNTRRAVFVEDYSAKSDQFTIHDANGESYMLPSEDLLRKWRPVSYWMLVACPIDRGSWPMNLSEHASRARHFEQRKDWDRADAEYLSALRESPQHTGLLIARANLLQKTNRKAEAESLYRRAIAANPGDGRAANNLAYLLADSPATLPEAGDLARRATTIEPTNPSTLDTLGYVYLKQGDYLAAASAFQRARDYAETLPVEQRIEITLHLIRAHIEQGRRDRARLLAKDILKMKPDYVLPPDAQALLLHADVQSLP